MAIVLPTVKSEPDNRWISQKIGMIGPAGIGKSEFWSIGNTLFAQCEAGLNHLKVMKTVITCWDDFREFVGALIQANVKKEFPWDTVVIDTIDKLVDYAQAEAVARGRAKFKAIEINTVGDIPNGAGWAWAQDLVENGLSKLEELPCAVVFVGHLDNKEIKEPTQSIHKQTISIGGKMGGMLVAWCDHFLNISAQSGQGGEIKRVVRTMPTRTLDAKSRGGMVPDGWVWDAKSEVNYNKLKSLFK
jgi:hypothetical protein